MIRIYSRDASERPNSHRRDDNGSDTMGKMNDDFIRTQRRNDMPKRERKIRDCETGIHMPHQRAENQLCEYSSSRCGAQLLQRNTFSLRFHYRQSDLKTRRSENGESNNRAKESLCKTRMKR